MNEERKLQQNTKGQYVIVIPPQVVRMLGWEKGDTIQLLLDAGDIRLRKKKE